MPCLDVAQRSSHTIAQADTHFSSLSRGLAVSGPWCKRHVLAVAHGVLHEKSKLKRMRGTRKIHFTTYQTKKKSCPVSLSEPHRPGIAAGPWAWTAAKRARKGCWCCAEEWVVPKKRSAAQPCAKLTATGVSGGVKPLIVRIV